MIVLSPNNSLFLLSDTHILFSLLFHNSFPLFSPRYHDYQNTHLRKMHWNKTSPMFDIMMPCHISLVISSYRVMQSDWCNSQGLIIFHVFAEECKGIIESLDRIQRIRNKGFAILSSHEDKIFILPLREMFLK